MIEVYRLVSKDSTTTTTTRATQQNCSVAAGEPTYIIDTAIAVAADHQDKASGASVQSGTDEVEAYTLPPHCNGHPHMPGVT